MNIDHDEVIYRLEEAGATLLALPPEQRPGRNVTEALNHAIDSYGWTNATPRPPMPPAQLITRMNEALLWLQFIPTDRYVLRRVVGARSLVHPITDRHLFPWRRLGAALGVDHKAVRHWHAQGIDMIVKALGRAS